MPSNMGKKSEPWKGMKAGFNYRLTATEAAQSIVSEAMRKQWREEEIARRKAAKAAEAERENERLEREKNRKVFAVRKVKDGYEVVRKVKVPKRKMLTLVLVTTETRKSADAIRHQLDRQANPIMRYFSTYDTINWEWQPIQPTPGVRHSFTIN